MEDQFRHEFLTHAWQTATPDDLPKRIPVSLLVSRILVNTGVACKVKDATRLLETHAGARRGHVDCHAPEMIFPAPRQISSVAAPSLSGFTSASSSGASALSGSTGIPVYSLNKG